MSSNFDFVSGLLAELRAPAVEAEAAIATSPRAACFHARFALEQALRWLYLRDASLGRPAEKNLNSLLHARALQRLAGPVVWAKMRAIQQLGNIAVHEARPIAQHEANEAVRELFHVLYWMSRSYSEDAASHPDVRWNAGLVPPASAQTAAPAPAPRDLERLAAEHEERRLELDRREAALLARLREYEALRETLHAIKHQNDAVADPHSYDEAQTRTNSIDRLLREAGWDPNGPDVREYEVSGMPTASGRGHVDYVLWGNDGRPLAVVEAKRAAADPAQGREQAKLYADCLEARFGQRPIVFYTNGLETFVWDDTLYPPRAVNGFYTESELAGLVARRSRRKLAHAPIDRRIVDRAYQMEAIRRVGEHLDAGHRRALLVMATGSGKTRTTAALIDGLIAQGWVRRVLFVADRDALVTQALAAFVKTVPHVSVTDLRRKDADEHAQVVFCTHQTMIRAIDEVRDGVRRFGPGCFDAVVVDEAHRSVYQRYGAIFDYFDGLLIGLTATPRDEVHRDTYGLFELPQGEPTFAYDLREAVAQGHLVPPVAIAVPFRFMTEGVRWDDLRADEREAFDELFDGDDADEAPVPRHINPSALYDWLFNADTVDQALAYLREHGQYVDGGARMGKTMVFARNHKHAEFIKERYDRLYPGERGETCRVIDYKTRYHERLLDTFKRPDGPIQIAVSVNMLDTGVDVPEVVNLVFFTPVRSRVRFHQMLGRGTRLCPNLLGPGDDKRHFTVFDLCGNFAYFGGQPEEVEAKPPRSLRGQVFRARLELAAALTGSVDPEALRVRRGALDEVHEHLAALPGDSFVVRRNERELAPLRSRSKLEALDARERRFLDEVAAELPTTLAVEDPDALRLDLLVLRTQRALATRDPALLRHRESLRKLATSLRTKTNLPAVAAASPLLDAVCDDAWWAQTDVARLESIRAGLRAIARFADSENKQALYVNFRDTLLGAEIVQAPDFTEAASLAEYRRRVERHIRENGDHIAIARIRQGLPLTATDLAELERMVFEPAELSNRALFAEVYGTHVSLPVFVRSLVGLDASAARTAFASWLDGTRFTADQIRFVDLIIDYLTRNGQLDPGLLYEPPFTGVHVHGLDGIFGDDEADAIVEVVRRLSGVG